MIPIQYVPRDKNYGKQDEAGKNELIGCSYTPAAEPIIQIFQACMSGEPVTKR